MEEEWCTGSKPWRENAGAKQALSARAPSPTYTTAKALDFKKYHQSPSASSASPLSRASVSIAQSRATRLQELLQSKQKPVLLARPEDDQSPTSNAATSLKSHLKNTENRARRVVTSVPSAQRRDSPSRDMSSSEECDTPCPSQPASRLGLIRSLKPALPPEARGSTNTTPSPPRTSAKVRQRSAPLHMAWPGSGGRKKIVHTQPRLKMPRETRVNSRERGIGEFSHMSDVNTYLCLQSKHGKHVCYASTLRYLYHEPFIIL